MVTFVHSQATANDTIDEKIEVLESIACRLLGKYNDPSNPLKRDFVYYPIVVVVMALGTFRSALVHILRVRLALPLLLLRTTCSIYYTNKNSNTKYNSNQTSTQQYRINPHAPFQNIGQTAQGPKVSQEVQTAALRSQGHANVDNVKSTSLAVSQPVKTETPLFGCTTA